MNPFRNFTIDHAIPKSRGTVNNNIHNMVPCCRDCNNKKADMDVFEYAWSLGDPEMQFAFQIKKWRYRVAPRAMLGKISDDLINEAFIEPGEIKSMDEADIT